MKRLTASVISLLLMLVAFSQETFDDVYSYGLDLIKAHDFSNAIQTLDKAYSLAPEKSRERSRAVWAKGMAYYMNAQYMRLDKDYERAYKMYADAITCFKRIGKYKEVMECTNSMAELNAIHFGFKNLALEQYVYAFLMAKELNLVDPQIEILMSTIAVLKSLHNEKEVIQVNARIDSIIAANKSHTDLTLLLYEKGENAYRNGDWNVAASCYEKFLTAEPRSGKRFDVLQKLRLTFANMGDNATALAYSEKCLAEWSKTFENKPSHKYLAYQNHYPFQIRAGDYNGALASIDSIQKSTDITGTDLAKGELLINRGRVYCKMERWSDAVRDFQTADSLLRLDSLSTAVKNKMESLIPLYAGALYRNNELEHSYIQYLRFLELMKSSYGERSVEYAKALCYLANIEGFVNKLNDGATHYIKSWEITRDIATRNLQFVPANARGHYWSEINGLIWDMIPYGIEARCQEDDFTAAAFEALMFSKGLLLSTEKSVGSQIQGSGDQELISDYTTLSNLRDELELLRKNDNRDEIMDLYNRMDSLDRTLSLKMAKLDIRPVVTNTLTSEIKALLEDNDVLIDFYSYTRKGKSTDYVALILNKEMRAPRLVKVFEQSKLDSLIARNNGNFSDLYEDYNSEELYNTIISPILAEIEGAKRIYFVPSGILNQIAIEAVRMPDGCILGEKYDVVRFTNAKELLKYKDSNRINDFSTAYLYGDLDYDIEPETMALSANDSDVSPILVMRNGTPGIKANEGFKKLRMSETEVNGIYDILAQNKVDVRKFVKEFGTEESFMNMSGKSPDLLLLSTHGFYYSPDNVPSWSSLNGYDNPMYLTGLVMSGGNAEYLKREVPEGVMGGLLTSADIARLDLSNTQLVILSACETGLGDTTNEGVYGLQRAFKKAGAQTLVMSLWPVSDLVTKEFMILFHKELAANSWDKRVAFNNAKRALRNKYSEPYYWAAFIMVD